MKSRIIYLLVLLSAVAIISCDDAVNPKADFREVYSLNFIINQDTSVTKSFNVEGFDPTTNTDDPFIPGAVIKIFYNDSVFVMRDTVKERSDTSRYKTPLHYYYIKNFRPNTNFPISVEATMPDGQVLKANATAFSLNRLFAFVNSTDIAPPVGSSTDKEFQFQWIDLFTRTFNSDVYFSPELVISYSYTENGKTEKREKKVAWYYVSGKNGDYAVYPPTTVKTTSLSFYYSNIDRALHELSEGDPNKDRYTIHGCLFRLLVMDKNVAAFYSVQKTFLDEFSVRVNQPEYSNIENGLGIFGLYAIQKINLKFQIGYLNSLGYKY